MHDGNMVTEGGGKGICLKVGRAYARLTDPEMKVIVQITHPQTQCIFRVIFTRKLWIKSDLIITGMMKKLTIKTHPCLRPDIFQEKAFAPTVMGKYDVRRETFFLKSHHSVITSLFSNNFCLNINNPGI